MNKKIKYVVSPTIFFTPAADYSFIDANRKSTFLIKDVSFYDLLLSFLTPKLLTDAEKKGFDMSLLKFLVKEGILIDSSRKDDYVWNKYNWDRSFYLIFSQMDLRYVEFDSSTNKSQSELIDERREYIKEYKKTKKYPSLYRPRRLCERKIKLKKYEEDFFDFDLIKCRESQRSFSDTKIPFETFNKVLYSSTKNIRMAETSKESGDDYFLLNSFYAWAVIYVYVQGVEGLQRGLYFYDVKSNSLRLIDEKINDKDILKTINGQYWFGGGGFCLFVGAHWERYMWIYRHSRAYTNLLIQMGEIAQEFNNNAISLGLDGWLTPAVAESEAASIFGISEKDGVDILLFMKFGFSVARNPDIKVIRRFRVYSDREKFQKKLHKGFATSDFDLEKDNIFLVRIRDKECLALKSKSGKFFLNMVPDNILLAGLSFFNITEAEKNKIKKKYNIKENLFRMEFFYDRRKFMQRLEKSKSLKRFVKKYSCVIKTKYSRKEVFKLFENWRKSFKERGKKVPSKEFFVQLLDYKNRSKYGIKILYFEIDGRLVGLKAVYPHHKNSKLLVMRYKCADHSYVGLDKFMDLTLTKLFDGYKYFTDGGDFTDEKFKSRFDFKLKQRKPDKIEKIYKVEVLSQK